MSRPGIRASTKFACDDWDLEAELAQTRFGMSAGSYHLGDIAAHPGGVAQRFGSCGQRDAAQVVRILDLHQRVDHRRMRKAEAESHPGQRVGLRQRAQNDNVAMAADEAERVVVGEIDIRFIDHQQPAVEALRQRAEVARRSQSARRRIGTADDREIGARVGECVERQREIGAERDVKDAGLLHQREGVVERVGRDGIRDGIAFAEGRAKDHREQFVGAVAGEDHVLGNRIEFGGTGDEFIGTRRRIKAQRGSRHHFRHRAANARRRRIRIFVGVELDQALAGTRLLAGPIRRHVFDRFAKHL